MRKLNTLETSSKGSNTLSNGITKRANRARRAAGAHWMRLCAFWSTTEVSLWKNASSWLRASSGCSSCSSPSQKQAFTEPACQR